MVTKFLGEPSALTFESLRLRIDETVVIRVLALTAFVLTLAGILVEELPARSGRPYVFIAGRQEFVLPPGYAFEGGQSEKGSRNGVIFTAFLPDLLPAKYGPTVEMVSRHKDLILATLSYNGPSYSGSATARLNERISGRTHSDGEPLDGYDVVKVFANEDMYVRELPNGGPATITCFRRTRLMPSPANLSCNATISLDEQEFPVRSDGRFPLTLAYSFSKSHLQDASLIYDKLRQLISRWEVP